MQASPQLRMDGSKPFATVHGERPPGDPHQHVHFYQDKLPFNAQRILIDAMIADDPALKALAAKKIARQAKQKVLPAEIADETGDNPIDIEDDEDDDVSGDVNLEAWLTGTKYHFFAVRNAIAERYKKRVSTIADAVMFLCGEQNVVPIDKLAPSYRGFMA